MTGSPAARSLLSSGCETPAWRKWLCDVFPHALSPEELTGFWADTLMAPDQPLRSYDAIRIRAGNQRWRRLAEAVNRAAA
jgi:hypothetical protein